MKKRRMNLPQNRFPVGKTKSQKGTQTCLGNHVDPISNVDIVNSTINIINTNITSDDDDNDRLNERGERPSESRSSITNDGEYNINALRIELEGKINASEDNCRMQVQSIKDSSKWVLGFAITILLSVFTWIVSQVINNKSAIEVIKNDIEHIESQILSNEN